MISKEAQRLKFLIEQGLLKKVTYLRYDKMKKLDVVKSNENAFIVEDAEKNQNLIIFWKNVEKDVKETEILETFVEKFGVCDGMKKFIEENENV